MRHGPSVLLLAGALSAAACANPLDWPRYMRLRERGVAADGLVTALDPGPRPAIYYSFRAGERVYSAVWKGAYENPEAKELAPGDRVIVFYLPKDPEVSCLGDPKELLRAQNGIISLVLLGLGAAGAWVVSGELRKASQ